MKTTSIAFVVSLCAFFPAPAFSQIDQSRPEVCGAERGQLVAVPGGVSAVVTPRTGDATFFISEGSPGIKLPIGTVQIEQVCPLANRQLGVFVNPTNGTRIIIVDTVNNSILDSFMSYDPVVSPDQKWIAYKKFYPRSTDLPASDEVLLYDLSKNAAQNRGYSMLDTEPLSGMDFDVGTAIYPAGWKNEPGDNVGQIKTQQHFIVSSLLWSPDSKSLVFQDMHLQKQSIVLVTFDEKRRSTALISPLPEACGGGSFQQVEFGPDQVTDRLLFVSFGSGGCAYQLHRNGFRPATVEVPELYDPTLPAKLVERRDVPPKR